MAYLALYRRFRPSSLGEVVRQEHIVTVLKNQIETGRIGHAYLFCGPRGTGKTSIAKIFAAAINCEHPVDGSPCGKCAACKALADPSNLDISEIDAASNNGVDEMRELREKVQYPPVAGKYKVYIVDEAHMLSVGAFNALLKTLEEPPAHAVFILATTESQKIPATILSRCMRFDFKLIPQADLEERLKSVLNEIGKTYEEEAVAAIARAGAGSVRDMLSLADTCVSYSSGKLTYEEVTAVLGSAEFSVTGELCSAILSGNTGDAFERTEAILSEGKSVSMLLKDVMNFLNACAVTKLCRDAQKILALPDDMFALVKKASAATEGHGLLRATEIFAAAENDLRYSVSPRIVFETAVFKASMPHADYEIESLLTRIERLEKRLESGDFVVQGVRETSAVTEEEPKKAVETEDVQEPAYAAYDNYGGFDETPPPEDGGVYFDEGFIPEEKPKKSEKPAPEVKKAEEPKQEVKPTVKVNMVSGDARATFGGFLRALRKTAKNGVLFTLCMDLDSAYENGVFVMYTESETIYTSLKKEEHRAAVAKAFEAIGISEFEIRLRGKKGDEFNQSLNELKEKFPNTKIEIK